MIQWYKPQSVTKIFERKNEYTRFHIFLCPYFSFVLYYPFCSQLIKTAQMRNRPTMNIHVSTLAVRVHTRPFLCRVHKNGRSYTLTTYWCTSVKIPCTLHPPCAHLTVIPWPKIRITSMVCSWHLVGSLLICKWTSVMSSYFFMLVVMLKVMAMLGLLIDPRVSWPVFLMAISSDDYFEGVKWRSCGGSQLGLLKDPRVS